MLEVSTKELPDAIDKQCAQPFGFTYISVMSKTESIRAELASRAYNKFIFWVGFFPTFENLLPLIDQASITINKISKLHVLKVSSEVRWN